MPTISLSQKLGAEALGTTLLLATVTASGLARSVRRIVATSPNVATHSENRLAGGNVALALLGNTIPAGADPVCPHHHAGADFGGAIQSGGHDGAAAPRAGRDVRSRLCCRAASRRYPWRAYRPCDVQPAVGASVAENYVFV